MPKPTSEYYAAVFWVGLDKAMTKLCQHKHRTAKAAYKCGGADFAMVKPDQKDVVKTVVPAYGETHVSVIDPRRYNCFAS